MEGWLLLADEDEGGVGVETEAGAVEVARAVPVRSEAGYCRERREERVVGPELDPPEDRTALGIFQ